MSASGTVAGGLLHPFKRAALTGPVLPRWVIFRMAKSLDPCVVCWGCARKYEAQGNRAAPGNNPLDVGGQGDDSDEDDGMEEEDIMIWLRSKEGAL